MVDGEARAERLTFALTVLDRWVETARVLGIPELVSAMERVHADTEAEWERALSAVAEAA